MADVTTAGVLKPSAGTYLWGYGNFWVSAEDAYGVTVQGAGFAYSDYSIQNGVACAGDIADVHSDVGYGVTNGGAHMAHWSMSRYIAKTTNPIDLCCRVRIWGETVNGWYGYHNGSWSGDRWSPLAIASTYIRVAALAAAATPPAPTVTGSGNSRTVKCPSVSNATQYRLYRTQNTAQNVQTTTLVGTVSANTAYTYSLSGNMGYRWYYQALGYDGVWRAGAVSAWHYTTAAAPSGLTAASSGTSVKLAWSVNTYGASSVRVDRSTTSSFSSYTSVYSGAVKTAHTDTPPAGGPYYYRVSAVGSTGARVYSNTASATTMQAPAAPSSFRRTGSLDSNTYVLAWTCNPTTQAPYGSVTVDTRKAAESWASSWKAALSGTAATWTLEDTGPAARYFRIKASNAAGDSAIVTIGPLYGAAASPTPSGSSGSSKGTYRFAWGYTKEPFPVAATVSFECQYAVSADSGATWGAWTAADPAVTPSSVTLAYAAPGMCMVRSRLRMRVGNVGDGVERVSGWVQSPDYTVSFAPALPGVAYDAATRSVTVSLPADDLGSSPDGRIVTLYVDGEAVQTWIAGADAATYTAEGISPASRFTLSAGVKTGFWPSEALTAVQTIDLDSCRIRIGGKRHLAFLVRPSGSVVPVSVALMRR